jgi:hypothetical protein
MVGWITFQEFVVSKRIPLYDIAHPLNVNWRPQIIHGLHSSIELLAIRTL